MIYNFSPNILILSLLTICATHASDTPDTNETGSVKGEDLFAAVVGVDRTAQLFGNTYKQAVILYKDHDQELEALKSLPDQVKNLSEEISLLRDEATNRSKEAKIREDKVKWIIELLAEQLNIRKLVKAYNSNQDWKAVKEGLEAVLDHNSTAFRQLQDIPTDGSKTVRIIGEKGYTELAAVLANLGSGADAVDVNATTMLQGAAIGGQVRTAAILLNSGANIESKDDWGSTPLVLAGKYDQVAFVKYLLEKGADVNGASYYGWTALYWAAYNGNISLVQLLVGAGAKTSLKDRDGKTPLEVAQEKGHTSVVEFLSHAS